MKKIVITLIALFLGVCPAYCYIKDYFNDFYDLYLSLRKISACERQIFDFLHEISNNKIEAFEDFLNSAETREDAEMAIMMIDEEYKDFLENLNFELNYTGYCPISKRYQKKLKNAHKKFMRTLENDYLP